MIELALSKLQKYYGANLILEDITFEVKTNEKVGIVGENGCGKSTLLKILMGIENYEKGMLSIRKGASLGYLEQMPSYPAEYTVFDVLNTAFEELDSVGNELKILEDKLSYADENNYEEALNKYSKLQQLYESLGGYEKEEKLSKVCTGLKMEESFKEKLFLKLSGGEKTTVVLGKILLQNPDILLLDEPSNHLDLESMEWLEAYLKDYKGEVIIVSHDRYFLDNVVSKIVEIESGESESYDGNYTAYEEEKERRLELLLHQFLEQQKEIKSMESAIARLRDWGSRGDNEKFFKRANSMQKALDKIQRINKPVTEKKKINIAYAASERSGNDVIIVKDLDKSYEKKILFKEANMLIRKGERVALIGANGSGKSTLINILLEEAKADNGVAKLGSSIKLGYLAQNIKFKDESKSILECFREDIVITEGKAREYLAKYMFFGEAVFKKVGSLSGGERSRLMLASLMYHEINLLILDEPTNHLDIDSRQELESFLKDFQGTIFFVSHDRYFINTIADRVVELSGGKLNSYQGNYEYYKEKAFGNKKAQVLHKEEKKQKNIDKPKEPSKEKIEASLEKNISDLEEKIKALEYKINASGNNYDKLRELYDEKEMAEASLEGLMDQYFKL
ncbi:ABC-F type ribosomal protection protein [Clostridium sp. 19966]|uniref:ribosomal protection-like ABC-F family protein n=1 Tax=Clostridium sp. 19966 TaxID=2768166 RepID=UPI0028DDA32E|nr:ABC-F type ribosomal protection protein [Clostridium sp. 19966]MDT8718370.1 ABC-F type ribosomal protection protein [Clostridium sp. 19966]